MDLMMALAATVLLLVFLVASLRKLRDPPATVKTLRGFGLTPSMAALLGPALPWAELAVVLLMLMPGAAVAGAGLALVLLAVFTAAILGALLRGKRPNCNCFGHASDKPIGWNTAARNAMLLALAASLLLPATRFERGLLELWLVAVRGFEPFALVALASAGLLALQSAVIGRLFSQQGRMLLRIDNLEHELAQGKSTASHSVQLAGPAQGALAPDFEFVSLAGGMATSMAHRFATQLDLMLVFVSPDCGPCHELLDWLLHQPDRNRAVIITSGSPEHNRRLRDDYEVLDIIIQSGQQAQDAYGVIGTPSAVRVRDGRIASPLAIGMAPIQSLFDPAPGGRASSAVAGAPRLA